MSTMFMTLSSAGVSIYYGWYPLYSSIMNVVTVLTSALSQGV